MKKIYLIMALACMVLVSCGKKDGGDGKVQGHEYVDLGLPSGTKWATRNIGAKSPDAPGHYFAWGETEPKDEYTKQNCLTYDKKMEDFGGNAEYDAATANWGDEWRTPTKEEMKELVEYCTWELTSEGEIYGLKVTGPNGASIIMPYAGAYSGSDYYNNSYGYICYYWTSSEGYYNSDAFALAYDNYNGRVITRNREFGMTVRAVTNAE